MLFIYFHFRRFAPNVSEVSQEFQQLAVQFTNANLFEYSALCYLAVSKCERALNNTLSEVHFLLRSARAYCEADRTVDRLHLRSNANEYINGALNCYNQAILLLNDDSVMKTGIIREMKRIHTNCELMSNFVSPAHRIYDLEMAANECIRTGDYAGALDKLTEVYDDITERKVQQFHGDVLQRNEVSRILLLLLLRLPPARQAPSNIKLLQKYGAGIARMAESNSSQVDSDNDDDYDHFDDCNTILRSIDVHNSCLATDSIAHLFMSCKSETSHSKIIENIEYVNSVPGITVFQQLVLKELTKSYE